MRALLEASPQVDELRRYDCPAYIAAAIGGLPSDIVDDPDRLTPGSYLHKRWLAGGTVEPDEWFEAFEQRVRDLVDDGMDPAFLVEAILDDLDRRYELMANTERANAARQRDRNGMLSILSDAEELERYRQRTVARSPELADLSIDEAAEQLRRLVERLPPIELDEEAGRLVELHQFRQDVDRLFGPRS